jgi:hypothetical protein
MDRVSLPASGAGAGTYATTPRDLSDLLLQDVEAGITERTTRLDDAIHAMQTFVQRARVGVETSFPISREFAMLWDYRFAAFQTWAAWKRREVYRENWIQWDELQQLEDIESFKFFRNQLRQSVLTTVEPGRPMWWGNPEPSHGPTLQTIQTREMASFDVQKESTFEGMSLVGTPLRDGRPSWLAPILGLQSSAPSSGGSNQGNSNQSGSGQVGSAGQGSGSGGSVVLHKVKMATAGQATSATAAATAAVQTSLTTAGLAESGLGALEVIPLWVQAAIRLGTRFIRVAAAGKARAIPYLASTDDKTHGRADYGVIRDDVVDEYYFWLQHSHYYNFNDATQDADLSAVSSTDPSTSWETADLLPGLLAWPSRPLYHLFWTRMRMGRLDPPRRSDKGVPIDPSTGATPYLTYVGRGNDSLYFTAVQQGSGSASTGTSTASGSGTTTGTGSGSSASGSTTGGSTPRAPPLVSVTICASTRPSQHPN